MKVLQAGVLEGFEILTSAWLAYLLVVKADHLDNTQHRDCAYQYMLDIITFEETYSETYLLGFEPTPSQIADLDRIPRL